MRVSVRSKGLLSFGCVLLLSILVSSHVLAAPVQKNIPATSGCPNGACPGYWYGANQSWMQLATGDFLEHQGNWCGIANIFAISRYDWQKYNGGYPPYNSQEAIYNHLNMSTSVSPWGRAVSGSGRQYGSNPSNLAANISADGGTDPRALALGIYDNTPSNYYIHNWIYRTTATTATYDFASDFGPANGVNNPISVTINGGMHSFVIDGVWANHDPSAPNTSPSIYYIDTWDPWLDAANRSFDGSYPYNTTQNEAWSLSDWTGLSKFWGQGYNVNQGFDPEPNTTGGNYYNSPPLTAHWGSYFVTIEQDGITTGPNYAYDQNSNLAPHN